MDPAPATPQKHFSKKIISVLLIVVTIAAVFLAFDKLVHQHTAKPINTAKISVANPKIRLALFATGLANPTAITSTGQAGDLRLFVLDQSGVIRIVNDDGTVSKKPFLDIRKNVLFGGEMGLLGLAFSPNYNHDGYFYINYINHQGFTVIARYHISSNAGMADANSAKTVLSFKQPFSNHNGGQLAFGPDGYLYIAVGDGGSAGDPGNRAQNLNSLFGKILRLDVSTLPYKVPATNPFANHAGKKAEIWDYGLRNPWRFSFDNKTHDLYIADVGQNKIEELDVEPAGSAGGNNFGWRCYEGDAKYNFANCQQSGNYVRPVLQYTHLNDRCAITGGYVYRGAKYPGLSGKYFYADYCSGELYWTEQVNGKWQSNLVVDSPYKITTFGQDNRGEIYLSDYATGTIYQIVDASTLN